MLLLTFLEGLIIRCEILQFVSESVSGENIVFPDKLSSLHGSDSALSLIFSLLVLQPIGTDIRSNGEQTRSGVTSLGAAENTAQGSWW